MAIYKMTNAQIFDMQFYIKNSSDHTDSALIDLTLLAPGDILLDTTTNRIKIVPSSEEWTQLHNQGWILNPINSSELANKKSQQVELFCLEQPYEDHCLSPNSDILGIYYFNSLDSKNDNIIQFARSRELGPFPNYYSIQCNSLAIEPVHFTFTKSQKTDLLRQQYYYTLTLTPDTEGPLFGYIIFFRKQSMATISDLNNVIQWKGYLVN